MLGNANQKSNEKVTCQNCYRMYVPGHDTRGICGSCLWHESYHQSAKYWDPGCEQCVADALAAKGIAIRIITARVWHGIKRAFDSE